MYIIAQNFVAGKTVEHYSGAYIVDRRQRGKRTGGAGRKGGIIIAVLLSVTAAICLLVAFLPRIKPLSGSAAPRFAGATFYFLALTETDDRAAAYEAAQTAVARGGAGYVYNDGRYRIIVAAYDKQSDANSLAAVNGGTHFEVHIPACTLSDADVDVLEYLTGEWFAVMNDAAAALDRQTTTEAAAELAARSACDRLLCLADEADDMRLRRTIQNAAAYAPPQGMPLAAYIRYVCVQAIAEISRCI